MKGPNSPAFRKFSDPNWANHLPLNVVTEFMGHSDVKTTSEFYTTVARDQVTHTGWIVEAVAMRDADRTDAGLTPAARIGLNRKVG